MLVEAMPVYADSYPYWDTEQSRSSAILNVFVMLLGLMTGKHLTTHIRQSSSRASPTTNFSRLGSGSLDYLMMHMGDPACCTGVRCLMVKELWATSTSLQSSTGGPNSLGSLFDSSLSDASFLDILGSLQKTSSTSAIPCTPPSPQQMHIDSSGDDLVVICQLRACNEAMCTDTERDREEELWSISTVNKSLGRLTMQMIDCLRLHPDDVQSVKGILSTGQTSLFFELTRAIVEDQNPELQYKGMARMDMFALQDQRLNSVKEGEVPTTSIEDVSDFLMQHYLFITKRVC
jgi:hypothetical protein